MSPQVDAGTLEYEWMSWPEIAQAAADGLPVVVTVGATEQHGPHLPVCADWVVPEAVVRRAARERRFVVGPALRLGYRSRPGSGGGQGFPGTLSLRATTFMAVVEDVLDELIRAGFRKIVLYNWHFENAGFVYEPAHLASARAPHVKIVVVDDGMPAFSEADLAELFPDGFPGLALEHAAVIETSMFLALRPDAVRMDRICDDAPQRHPAYDVLPIDPSLTTATGVLSSATQASQAKGKLLVDRVATHVLNIVEAEFPETVPAEAAIDA